MTEKVELNEAKPGTRRRPADTIRHILAAAREEFAAHGFDGTRVEHIARRAKVSKQLVYLYFNGKEELYGELAREVTREIYASLNAIDLEGMAPREAIRAYISGIYDHFANDPVIAMVTLDESLHQGAHLRLPGDLRRKQQNLRDRMAQVIQRGREAGEFGEYMDAITLEFTTVILVSGCVSSRTMFARFAGQETTASDTELLREHAITLVLRAMRA